MAVAIVPLRDLCTQKQMFQFIPADSQIPVFIVHLGKWEEVRERSRSKEDTEDKSRAKKTRASNSKICKEEDHKQEDNKATNIKH